MKTVCTRSQNNCLWTQKKVVAYVHEHTTTDGWYRLLGHSSFKIINYLICTFSLPTNKNNYRYLYTSCSQNKAHCQQFNHHSLISSATLELIYTNVCGPSHNIGTNGSNTIFFLLIILPDISSSIPCSNYFSPISSRCGKLI